MEVDMVADGTLFQLVLLRLIAHLRLQFDKLFRDFVGRPLAEDSQNRPPGLVHVHSATERKPTSARTLRKNVIFCLLLFSNLVHDVFQLHHRDTDELIVATKAVILHPDVQLVGRHLLLVADDAEEQERVDKSGGEEKQGVDLQVESLVELWRPIAGLLFCLELPLLIRKVRT